MQIATFKTEAKAWQIEKQALLSKVDWYEKFHKEKFGGVQHKDTSSLEAENHRLRKKIVQLDLMLKNYEIGNITEENKIIHNLTQKLTVQDFDSSKERKQTSNTPIPRSKPKIDSPSNYSYDSQEAFELLKNANILNQTHT